MNDDGWVPQFAGDVPPSVGRSGMGVGGAMLAMLATLGGILVLNAGGGPDKGEGVVSGVPTSFPTTTTTIRPPRSIAIDDAALARAELAVFDENQIVLLTLDGTELARTDSEGWHVGNPASGVDIVPVADGRAIAEAPAIDDPVAGCEIVSGGGGVRAAVCRPEPSRSELRLIATDGSTRFLAGPVNSTGHWRYAVPSPDGAWVLAQWSGECEVPVAYLFPTVENSPGRPLAAPDVESVGAGWTPDGRAVVSFLGGACGAADDAPGTYLVDPKTGQRQRLHSYVGAALLTPSKGVRPNQLERVLERARRELKFDRCCQQASSYPEGATDGFVFEGHQVVVQAAPLRFVPQGSAGALRVDCGQARFHLTGGGPSRSDEAVLRRAAALVIPRLYCTPGPIQRVDD